MLKLKNGRILLTYTQRSLIYPIGLRAILSHDDGQTWDFENDRIVIEAKTPWGGAQGGGFGNTVQLDNGALVSCYSYNPGQPGAKTEVEVVRWRLPASPKKSR